MFHVFLLNSLIDSPTFFNTSQQCLEWRYKNAHPHFVFLFSPIPSEKPTIKRDEKL